MDLYTVDPDLDIFRLDLYQVNYTLQIPSQMYTHAIFKDDADDTYCIYEDSIQELIQASEFLFDTTLLDDHHLLLKCSLDNFKKNMIDNTVKILLFESCEESIIYIPLILDHSSTSSTKESTSSTKESTSSTKESTFLQIKFTIKSLSNYEKTGRIFHKSLRNKLLPTYSEVLSFNNLFIGNIEAGKMILDTFHLDKRPIGLLIGCCGIFIPKEFMKSVRTISYFHENKIIRYNTPTMTYLRCKIEDEINFDIEPFLNITSNIINMFIENDENVVIFCYAGISRSATILLNYLMTSIRLSLKRASMLVLKTRSIRPNDGFLKKLCDIDKELHEHK